MNITFTPLTSTHFPILLRWLETPHVKAWWDPAVNWTLALITDKYTRYTHGFTPVNGEFKPIQAYIICLDQIPIGYIQSYAAHDFPRGYPLTGLPASLASFDMYIGEVDYLGKGYGVNAISTFLSTMCNKKFSYAFVDPDKNNIAAIKTYEKVGFKKIMALGGKVWMLRNIE